MPQAHVSTVPARAVLFDLDGTLIDSAPDLAGAANDMRAARGLPPLPYEALRPMVGSGARGMVGRAFDIGPQDDAFTLLRDEFLTRYEARMTRDTCLFAGIASMLARLQDSALPWGIVTNKATRFAAPLAQALDLARGAAVLVCGDTTPHSKPHPAPLLEAAQRIGVAAGQCIYVGDDLRDVQAGQAAGMRTVAVSWGYLGVGAPIEAWGADHIVASTDELLNLLHLA